MQMNHDLCTARTAACGPCMLPQNLGLSNEPWTWSGTSALGCVQLLDDRSLLYQAQVQIVPDREIPILYTVFDIKESDGSLVKLENN